MEIMVHIVKIKIMKVLYFLLFFVLPISFYGQNKKIKVGDPFSYIGTSKLNLTKNSSDKLLVKDLTTGAYLSSQNSSCRSDIGLYLFKVDSKGKINGNDIIYFVQKLIIYYFLPNNFGELFVFPKKCFYLSLRLVRIVTYFTKSYLHSTDTTPKVFKNRGRMLKSLRVSTLLKKQLL